MTIRDSAAFPPRGKLQIGIPVVTGYTSHPKTMTPGSVRLTNQMRAGYRACDAPAEVSMTGETLGSTK